MTSATRRPVQRSVANPNDFRALAEPAEDLAFPGPRQLAVSRRRRLGFHAIDAVIALGCPPELDGPFRDAEEMTNLHG